MTTDTWSADDGSIEAWDAVEASESFAYPEVSDDEWDAVEAQVDWMRDLALDRAEDRLRERGLW